jgi:hypothetical protein
MQPRWRWCSEGGLAGRAWLGWREGVAGGRAGGGGGWEGCDFHTSPPTFCRGCPTAASPRKGDPTDCLPSCAVTHLGGCNPRCCCCAHSRRVRRRECPRRPRGPRPPKRCALHASHCPGRPCLRRCPHHVTRAHGTPLRAQESLRTARPPRLQTRSTWLSPVRGPASRGEGSQPIAPRSKKWPPPTHRRPCKQPPCACTPLRSTAVVPAWAAVGGRPGPASRAAGTPSQRPPLLACCRL